MKKFILAVLIAGPILSPAQSVGINTDGSAPNASSILDINSTTQGILIPRMTAAQIAAINPLPAAAQGLMIYQTDGVQGIYYNTSTTTTPNYVYVLNSATGGWTTTGNSGTSAASNFIGTTDAVDFIFKTTGTERLRIASDGVFTITNATATVKPFIIKAAASQSANLTEWQNSSSTALTYIKSDGTTIVTGTDGGSTTGLGIRRSDGAGTVYLGTEGNMLCSYSTIFARNGIYCNGNIQRAGGSGETITITSQSGGGAIIQGVSTSSKTLVAKAVASQTSNLQEWQNSSGTALSIVDPSGRFGIGGAANANAMLDITGTDAMVLPIGTTGQRPTAEAGMLRYNSTTSNLEYYHSAWSALMTTDNSWQTAGNTGTTNGTHFIGTADNVALDFRTNNTIRTRITTKGQIEVLNTGAGVFIGEGAGAADDLTNNYNSLIGYQAGAATSTGEGNVAMGYQSLKTNTTGWYNTAVGYKALYANVGATHYNTAIGGEALVTNTTGQQNVSVGYQALKTSGDAWANTAVGYKALYSTTEDDNTAIGTEAAYTTSTGMQNVAVGKKALYLNTGSWANTAVGYQALYTSTGGDNTALGTEAAYTTSTGQQNVAVGKKALYLNAGSWANTAVGYEALYTSTGGDNTALGTEAARATSTGQQNVAVGKKALYTNTTSWANTAVGYQALYLSTGGDNTALGTEAAYTMGAGQQNVAVGKKALYSNSTAWANTAVGYEALYTSTSGVNDAFGAGALRSTTDGQMNAAFGFEALKANTSAWASTAMGYQALENSTGGENTAFGTNALYTTGTGEDNTAIGAAAGYSNSTGSRNVFIGYNAGYSETGSDKLYIDNSNTTSPLVYGDFSSNRIGINCNSPQVAFHVSGDIRATNVINTAALACSDIRYKKDVTGLKDNLDKLLQLKPVNYYWKKEEFPDWGFTDKKQIGFIAQEIEMLFPELVFTDAQGYKAVDYSKLTPILAGAIQEQQAQIDVLKKENLELISRLMKIEAFLQQDNSSLAGEKATSSIK